MSSPNPSSSCGSRARGEHEELLSDIDVMLVQATEPDDAIQKAAAAARVARETYGREGPVELVWKTTNEFRHNRRYVNSVETHAVKDGIIMPRDPNQKGSSQYEDKDTEYSYNWESTDITTARRTCWVHSATSTPRCGTSACP